MSENTPKTKRLFVGGLFDEVTPEDLKQRFAKYGNVMSVDLKAKRNSFGDIVKTFAFIDFDSTPAKLKQCIDVFNKTKWKGRELRIQPAEDSFLDKLAKERQSQSVVKIWSPEQHKPGYNKEPQHLKVKGAPGTAIEGKEGWVVGKYSQPVPVLRVKRGDGKKTVIFDPSKNCHGLKRFDKDDNVPNVSLDQLTWRLEEKQLPPKAAILKPSRRKIIQATKKMTSDDSDSASGSESERNETVEKSNSFVGTPAQHVDDSDNESRGSCDTDEIVRRAKKGKTSNKKQDVSYRSPISNVKPASSSLAKVLPSNKYQLNKELIFSEFSDGVSCSSDVEKELDSNNESIEDVFDLLKSGQIEKLLNTSQSQPSKSKKEEVIPESSRKRKKPQSESPTLVKDESCGSSESAKESRKRKVVKMELKSNIAGAGIEGKIPPEAEIESMSALVTCEKSKRRKISQLDSENKFTSTGPTKQLENADLRSSKTSALAEKSKKRKRSDFELEENQTSKTDMLEVKQATCGTLKNLEHNETKEAAKPTEPKRHHSKESNTEAVEKRVLKDSPMKKESVSEQKKALEILHSVSPVKANQTMGFRDFQSFRYDPSAADHDKFEINDEEQQRQQPAKVKREEKETLKLPSTEVKRFSEVDASVFNASADAPFSLGALFVPEESSDDEAESQPVLPNWKKKPKVVVDNENDEKYENNTKSKSRVSKNIDDGFFYHFEDPRLKASKFCREKDLEELRAEWQEKRPHLVESYRMKKKKPLRSFGKVTRPKGKSTFHRGNVFKKNRTQ